MSIAQRMYSAIENHSNPRNSVISVNDWSRKHIPAAAVAISA